MNGIGTDNWLVIKVILLIFFFLFVPFVPVYVQVVNQFYLGSNLLVRIFKILTIHILPFYSSNYQSVIVIGGFFSLYTVTTANLFANLSYLNRGLCRLRQLFLEDQIDSDLDSFFPDYTEKGWHFQRGLLEEIFSNCIEFIY